MENTKTNAASISMEEFAEKLRRIRKPNFNIRNNPFLKMLREEAEHSVVRWTEEQIRDCRERGYDPIWLSFANRIRHEIGCSKKRATKEDIDAIVKKCKKVEEEDKKKYEKRQWIYEEFALHALWHNLSDFTFVSENTRRIKGTSDWEIDERVRQADKRQTLFEAINWKNAQFAYLLAKKKQNAKTQQEKALIDDILLSLQELTGDKKLLEYVAGYGLYKSVIERKIEYVFGADAPIVKYLKERE